MSILVQELPMPGYDAPPAVSGWLERVDSRDPVNCVSKKDRAVEFPLEDRQKREGIDPRRMAHKARSNGEAEQAMSDGASERTAVRRGVVNVDRIEVSGEAGEQDDLGLCNRAARALPFVTHSEIIERPDRPRMTRHVSWEPPYRSVWRRSTQAAEAQFQPHC